MRQRELVEMRRETIIAIERGYHLHRSIEEKGVFRVISALPMHLCTFSRVGMPVIHFSIWYSLGKWRERGVIMARRSIMIMMVR